MQLEQFPLQMRRPSSGSNASSSSLSQFSVPVIEDFFKIFMAFCEMNALLFQFEFFNISQ